MDRKGRWVRVSGTETTTVPHSRLLQRIFFLSARRRAVHATLAVPRLYAQNLRRTVGYTSRRSEDDGYTSTYCSRPSLHPLSPSSGFRRRRRCPPPPLGAVYPSDAKRVKKIYFGERNLCTSDLHLGPATFFWGDKRSLCA